MHIRTKIYLPHLKETYRTFQNAYICYNKNWNLSQCLRIKAEYFGNIQWKVTYGFWSFRRNSELPNNIKKHSPLQSWANCFTWYFEGHNIGKKSFILCPFGQAVRAQCVLILLLPRNSKGSSQSVCRVAHSLTGGELTHCRKLWKEIFGTRYTVNRCYTTPRVIWES